MGSQRMTGEAVRTCVARFHGKGDPGELCAKSSTLSVLVASIFKIALQTGIAPVAYTSTSPALMRPLHCLDVFSVTARSPRILQVISEPALLLICLRRLSALQG